MRNKHKSVHVDHSLLGFESALCIVLQHVRVNCSRIWTSWKEDTCLYYNVQCMGFWNVYASCRCAPGVAAAHAHAVVRSSLVSICLCRQAKCKCPSLAQTSLLARDFIQSQPILSISQLIHYLLHNVLSISISNCHRCFSWILTNSHKGTAPTHLIIGEVAIWRNLSTRCQRQNGILMFCWMSGFLQALMTMEGVVQTLGTQFLRRGTWL